MAVQSKQLFSYQSLVHAVSGAIGSMVGMVVFYPLDTVRCRLQLEDNRKAKSTIHIINDLINEEGVLTLYRGILPVLQSICASNFVYFYVYNGLKGSIGTERRDLLLASLAGVVNVLITTPLWMVNTRMKMAGISNAAKYNGLIAGLIDVWKNEGPSRLWSGTVPSLILVSNPAIHMAVYEAVKRRAGPRKNISVLSYFLMSAFSKMIATILTYPLQLVQTKLRHGHGFKDLSKDASTINLLAYLIKNQGFGSLYKGMEAKLLQTVLTTALMFTTYEKIVALVFRLMYSGGRHL